MADPPKPSKPPQGIQFQRQEPGDGGSTSGSDSDDTDMLTPAQAFEKRKREQEEIEEAQKRERQRREGEELLRRLKEQEEKDKRNKAEAEEKRRKKQEQDDEELKKADPELYKLKMEVREAKEALDKEYARLRHLNRTQGRRPYEEEFRRKRSYIGSFLEAPLKEAEQNLRRFQEKRRKDADKEATKKAAARKKAAEDEADRLRARQREKERAAEYAAWKIEDDKRRAEMAAKDAADAEWAAEQDNAFEEDNRAEEEAQAAAEAEKIATQEAEEAARKAAEEKLKSEQQAAGFPQPLLPVGGYEQDADEAEGFSDPIELDAVEDEDELLKRDDEGKRAEKCIEEVMKEIIEMMKRVQFMSWSRYSSRQLFDSKIRRRNDLVGNKASIINRPDNMKHHLQYVQDEFRYESRMKRRIAYELENMEYKLITALYSLLKEMNKAYQSGDNKYEVDEEPDDPLVFEENGKYYKETSIYRELWWTAEHVKNTLRSAGIIINEDENGAITIPNDSDGEYLYSEEGERPKSVLPLRKLWDEMEGQLEQLAKLVEKDKLTQEDCEEAEKLYPGRADSRITNDSIAAAWRSYVEYLADFSAEVKDVMKKYDKAMDSRSMQLATIYTSAFTNDYKDKNVFSYKRDPNDPNAPASLNHDQLLWNKYVENLLLSAELQGLVLSRTEAADVEHGPDKVLERLDFKKVARHGHGGIMWTMRPNPKGLKEEATKGKMDSDPQGVDGLLVFYNTAELYKLVQQDGDDGHLIDWFQPKHVDVEYKDYSELVYNKKWPDGTLEEQKGESKQRPAYVLRDMGGLKLRHTLTDSKGKIDRRNELLFHVLDDEYRRVWEPLTESRARKKAEEEEEMRKKRRLAEGAEKKGDVKSGHMTIVPIRLNERHKLWWISGKLKNKQMMDVPTLLTKKLGEKGVNTTDMVRGVGDASGSDALTPLLTNGNMNVTYEKAVGINDAFRSNPQLDYGAMYNPNTRDDDKSSPCDLSHLGANKPDFYGKKIYRAQADKQPPRRVYYADIRQEAVRIPPTEMSSTIVGAADPLSQFTQYGRLFRAVYWAPLPLRSLQTFPAAQDTKYYLNCPLDGLPYALAFSQASGLDQTQPEHPQEYHPEITMFKQSANNKVANDNVNKNGAEAFIRRVRPTHWNKAWTPNSVHQYAPKQPPQGDKNWIAYKNSRDDVHGAENDEYKQHVDCVDQLTTWLSHEAQHNATQQGAAMGKKPAQASSPRLDAAGKYIYQHCRYMAPETLKEVMMQYLYRNIPRRTFPCMQDGGVQRFLKNTLFVENGLHVLFYGDRGKRPGEGGVDSYEPLSEDTTLAQFCDGKHKMRDFGEIMGQVEPGHWNYDRVGPPHWFLQEKDKHKEGDSRTVLVDPDKVALLDAADAELFKVGPVPIGKEKIDGGVDVNDPDPEYYYWASDQKDDTLNKATFLNHGVPPKKDTPLPHTFEKGELQLFPPLRITERSRKAVNRRLNTHTIPRDYPDNCANPEPDEKQWLEDYYGPLYVVILDQDDVDQAIVATEVDWAILMSQGDNGLYVVNGERFLLVEQETRDTSYLLTNHKYNIDLENKNGSGEGGDNADKHKDAIKTALKAKGMSDADVETAFKACTRPRGCSSKWWWEMRRAHGRLKNESDRASPQQIFKDQIGLWLWLFNQQRIVIENASQVDHINTQLKDSAMIMRRCSLILNWIIANPLRFGNSIAGASKDPLGDSGVFMLHNSMDRSPAFQSTAYIRMKYCALAMYNDVLETARAFLVQLGHTTIQRAEVANQFVYTGGGAAFNEKKAPFVKTVIDKAKNYKVNSDLPSMRDAESIMDILFAQMKQHLATIAVEDSDGRFYKLCVQFQKAIHDVAQRPGVRSALRTDESASDLLERLARHIKTELLNAYNTIKEEDRATVDEVWIIITGQEEAEKIKTVETIEMNAGDRAVDDSQNCNMLCAVALICFLENNPPYAQQLAESGLRLHWVSTAMYLFTKTLLQAMWNDELFSWHFKNEEEDEEEEKRAEEELQTPAVKKAEKARQQKREKRTAAMNSIVKLTFVDHLRIGNDGVLGVDDHIELQRLLQHYAGQQSEGDWTKSMPEHVLQWNYMTFLTTFLEEPVPQGTETAKAAGIEGQNAYNVKSTSVAIAATMFSNFFFELFNKELSGPIREAWELWQDARSHAPGDDSYPFNFQNRGQVERILTRFQETLLLHVKTRTSGTARAIAMMEHQLVEQRRREETTTDANDRTAIQALIQQYEADLDNLRTKQEAERASMNTLVSDQSFEDSYLKLGQLVEKILSLIQNPTDPGSKSTSVLKQQMKRNVGESGFDMQEVSDLRRRKQRLETTTKELQVTLVGINNLSVELRELKRTNQPTDEAKAKRLKVYSDRAMEIVEEYKELTKDDPMDGGAGSSATTSAVRFAGSLVPSLPPSPPGGSSPTGEYAISKEKLDTCVKATPKSDNDVMSVQELRNLCEAQDVLRAMNEDLNGVKLRIGILDQKIRTRLEEEEYNQQIHDAVYEVYLLLRDVQRSPIFTIEKMQQKADKITTISVKSNMESESQIRMRTEFGTPSDSGVDEYDLTTWDGGRELYGLKGAYMQYFMSHFNITVPTGGDVYVRVMGVPMCPEQWRDRLRVHTILSRPPEQRKLQLSIEVEQSIQQLKLMETTDVSSHIEIIQKVAQHEFHDAPEREQLIDDMGNLVVTSHATILGQFKQLYKSIVGYK